MKIIKLKSLKDKIEISNRIINQAFQKYPKKEIAIAWTGGKDSTVILHLIKKLFAGHVPVRVFFNDTGWDFEEIYDFIDNVTKKWGLNLIRVFHSDKDRLSLGNLGAFGAKKIKIKAIKKGLKEYGIGVYITGVRWDEHPARSNEAYFSKKVDHVRVNPILHFSEEDVWNYIREFEVPYASLYDKGYRSLGEKIFTKPVGKASRERGGRQDGDDEIVMQRLRSLGYW